MNNYNQVDVEAVRLMAQEDVQGLALAIIDGGTPVHVAAYGWRNAEKEYPLTTNTVMYGASLTKPTFAYIVLQLVAERQLTLDVSIADLLPCPLPDYDTYVDLGGDDRWRSITPRILLTHSCGFANFRWLESDGLLQLHFTPGSRYAYSGEGYNLLQFVLEESLGVDIGDEMQRCVFDPLGMSNTSMKWRSDFAANVADGYATDGSVKPHHQRGQARAAGSMDTTIGDQARLWAAFMRGDGLPQILRSDMLKPQLPITSAHQFPTLTTQTDPRNAEIGLAAGLGLVTFRSTVGPVWFKGGHDDWTGNMVVCLENQKRCAVMLSNDVRAERIYPDLVQMILGDIQFPWAWEYSWLES